MKEIKKIWDKAHSQREEKGDRALVWANWYNLLFKKFMPHISKAASSIILEAGCGVSLLMNTFASSGISTIGLDVSLLALRKARALFQVPALSLVAGDIFHLPFKDSQFSVVYSVGVIEHFLDPAPAMEEMVRVLKSDSILVVAVPNKYSLWTLGRVVKSFLSKLHMTTPWEYGYEKSYTKRELKKLLMSLGLSKTSVSGCGVFEGFYITTYFALRRPRLLIQLLYPLLTSQITSQFGKFLDLFAKLTERIDSLGILLIAVSIKE